MLRLTKSLSLFLFILGLFLLIPFRPVRAAYNASDVLGQLDGSGNPVFTTNNSGTSSTTLYRPSDISVDAVHHRLFVGNAANNSVFITTWIKTIIF